MGCSVTCGFDGTGDAVAVYMLDAAFRAHMDDVFLGAKELSRELDACGDGDVDDGDHDDVDGASTFGFFMSPAVAEDSSLHQSGVCSALSPLQPSSSTAITKAADAPNFSCTCSLAIHCVGLVPLRSPVVQLALHALLRGSMRNLLSLSLRLLPASLILPDLQNSLSRLGCLQHLSLQLGSCSSSDSTSIMHAIARMPQLSSLQLQGLDLSGLLQSSASITMAAPISTISFSDVPPPPVAVAAAARDSTAITSTAATMPLSHIALVLHSCTSTLQSLTITGKQDISIEQTGSWRALCHAIAPCLLLHTLDVSKSGIDAVGCVGLAYCLRRLVRLIKLDVSGNPLAAARVTPEVDDMVNVGAGVLMLANALEGLTGLTSLLIRKCCVNRCGAVALLQALHAHTSLTCLAIGGNQYSGLPHAVHELVVINEGFARMTCASDSAVEYDAYRAHAEAIRAVFSEGDSMEHAVGALKTALAPVNMSALAAQLLQPSVHYPPAALPQLLLGVIGNNRALINLDLADLCLPSDALPLLATAWLQGAVPPIHFGDFRCRVDACAGHARQVAAAWAAVVQAAVASYERRGRKMPLTLRWHSFV